MARKFINLTGKKFGYLTVIKESGRNSQNRRMYLCSCECGNTKVISGDNLRHNRTKSCGCLSKEVNSKLFTTHGKTKTAEYVAWENMIRRCTNPNHPTYKHYGGRGINVCERWMKFEHFLEDMGKKPSSDHSIERKDNNLGYCPENCIWATMDIQARNRRVSNGTGYKGIYYHKQHKKYHVRITVNYKTISVGYFKTLNQAISARKQAVLKYWGKSS